MNARCHRGGADARPPRLSARPLAALQAPMLSLLLCLAAGASAGATTDDDIALQRQGRALFRGEVPLAQPATVQGVALPGAACAGCHGPRGEARREAGIDVPSIQWQPLTAAREAQPAYPDAQAVLGAIEHGLGRQAQPLQAPMPRYAFTAAERGALLAYLRVLGTESDPVPGVTADRVVVGSVLPLTGPQAAVGARIRAAMAARFEAVNAAGGVFGRRIELRAIDAGADAAGGSNAARDVLEVSGGGLFAFVGSLLPEPDDALRQRLRTHDTPMVATLGVPNADATMPQLTYLLPSLAAQVRQLVAELARRCGTPEGTARVLHPAGTPLARELATALPALQFEPIASEAQLDGALRRTEPLPVIALLPPGGVARLRAQWRAAGTPACLGTLAVVSGPQTAEEPPFEAAGRHRARFIDLVALPMPPLLDAPGAPAGATLWETLGDAAAQVFAETLARSGRGVDPARFQRALETLHRFQPAAGLSLTFGPTQRHGFDMAYLSKENPHALPSR